MKEFKSSPAIKGVFTNNSQNVNSQRIMKSIIKLSAILFLISTKCFGQSATSSPLEMTIKVDTVYTYPYTGLWFRDRFNIKSILGYEKAYKIKVTLRNSRKKRLYFYMMTCSKLDNLVIDNELFDFLFWGCDSNYPTRRELKEGETHTFYIEIIKHLDYFTTKKATLKALFSKTRLGLVLISDLHDEKYIMDSSERMDDKSKWTGIIWSNILDL